MFDKQVPILRHHKLVLKPGSYTTVKLVNSFWFFRDMYSNIASVLFGGHFPYFLTKALAKCAD